MEEEKKPVDWREVELYYLQSDASGKDVAEHFSIPIPTLYKHMVDGKWAETRKAIHEETRKKLVEKIKETDLRSQEARLKALEAIVEDYMKLERRRPFAADVISAIKAIGVMLGEADSRSETKTLIQYEFKIEKVDFPQAREIQDVQEAIEAIAQENLDSREEEQKLLPPPSDPSPDANP